MTYAIDYDFTADSIFGDVEQGVFPATGEIRVSCYKSLGGGNFELVDEEVILGTFDDEWDVRTTSLESMSDYNPSGVISEIELIKNYRKVNGLSQQQLADSLKVNKRTVQYWESGQRLPSFSVLELLRK